MELGFALPQFDFSLPGQQPLAWDAVVRHAKAAETAGYTSLWLADHIFWSLEAYGGAARDWPGLDPFVGLGALAVAVPDVRLGTLVVSAVLRSPGVLAKMLVTVDCVSGGRVIAGLGTGWFEPEHVAAGVTLGTPRQRLERLEETIAIVRGLSCGESFRFFGHSADVESETPRPPAVQQPAPPVWVGGKGPRLIDLAVRVADGWNTSWSVPLADYRRRLEVFERACERHGRDPASITRSACVYAHVGHDEADVRARFEQLVASSPPGVLDGVPFDQWREGRIVGTVAQAAEQFAEWSALGVDHLVVCTGAVPFAAVVPDDVETVAAACTLALQ